MIAGNFLLQAASVVLLLSGPRPMLLYVACAMFGLGVGNTTSLPSVIVQAEFPKAAFGRVVSTIIAINQFTYAFGPGLLGWLRDGFGSYHASLAACLVLVSRNGGALAAVGGGYQGGNPGGFAGRGHPAAYRALHRRRPTGPRPISGQKNIRRRGGASWPATLQPGQRRKCGAHFLHHVRPLQLRLARGGEKFAQLPQR